MEGGDNEQGPNNVGCVIWAIGKVFFLFFHV